MVPGSFLFLPGSANNQSCRLFSVDNICTAIGSSLEVLSRVRNIRDNEGMVCSSLPWILRYSPIVSSCDVAVNI